MANLQRLLAEQASQVLAIAVSFLDRLLLTAIVYRVWGTAVFEQWSFCVATAGLVAMFEFGVNLYLTNKIAMETETGSIEQATRTYKIANFMSILSACLGLGYLLLFSVFFKSEIVSANSSQIDEWSLVVFFLSASLVLKTITNGANSLYRANRQFARQTNIAVFGELMRVLVSIAIVLAGFGPVWVSLGAFLVAFFCQFAFVWWDVTRRFVPHGFGLAVPNWRELKDGFAVCAGFMAQILPILFLTNAPVILLARDAPATGVIAAVVLARTVVNLPRALLQSFSTVIGFECARRLAARDFAGVKLVWCHSARIIAAISGLIGGLILAAGPQIFLLWTSDPQLFKLDYLLVAALPMAIGTTSIINHNVLAASNVTFLPAIGRIIQLALTIVLYYVLPLSNSGLRMLSALTAGEILGFMPLAALAMRQLVPAITFRAGLEAFLVSTLSFLAAMLTTSAILGLEHPAGTLQIILALALCGFCTAAMLPWLGADRTTRKSIWAAAMKTANGSGFSRLTSLFMFRKGSA